MTEAPDNAARLERRFKRERAARKRAEELLEERSRELYHSQRELESAYAATVEVFASLVAGRTGRTNRQLRAMGRRARALARRIGLGDDDVRVTYLAASLCELGKLALPDDLIGKAYIELTRAERVTFQTHPRLAYEALLALSPLEAVALTIYRHCEHFDGKGYPEGLTWDDVPQTSQVLAVVKDFDALLSGVLVRGELTEEEALAYLLSHRGTRYSGELVDAFVALRQEKANVEVVAAEQRLTPISLREGMQVTRDLINDRNVLILPEGQILIQSMIDKLRAMVEQSGQDFVVYVCTPIDSEDEQLSSASTGDAAGSVG